MRTQHVLSALFVVLAVAPLRAQTPVIGADDACRQLQAKALTLTGEKVRCEATPAGLILRDVSANGLDTIKTKLCPEQKYLGFALVEAPASSALRAVGFPVKAQAEALTAAQARVNDVTIAAQAAAGNFDNSVSRSALTDGANVSVWGVASGESLKDAVADVKLTPSNGGGLVLVQQGPPGSGGGQQQQPPRSGPPGSGGDQQQPPRGGPPGSGSNPPRTGPPGSNPPGGNPPGGSTPPSRPAPVWRSNFPPPAPNWWNTDFNHYNWWNSLPSGYDRPYTDTSSPDSFYYYSGWYRWRDTFVTNWDRTEDTAAINRTAANQGQVQNISLTSQIYRESKQCYYQAVYRYDWEQGGFNGSHWEEHFDHYKASCIRLPREYGQPRVYTTFVSFDMTLAAGQDLPWESDVIRVTYDGSGQPRYDISGAAYRYSVRLDNQRNGSESVTLVAGPKVLRAPEADKVQAFVRKNGAKYELVVNDDRAQFYAGETLRVNVKVTRRVVYKVKGLLWGWNEKTQDTVIYSQPQDITVDASAPQSVSDITSQSNGANPANFVRSSLYIESWEFSRVNSRISTNAVIRKGQGNSIPQ